MVSEMDLDKDARFSQMDRGRKSTPERGKQQSNVPEASRDEFF